MGRQESETSNRQLTTSETGRFHLSTSAELENLAKKQVPKETQDSTKWALVFLTWVDDRSTIIGTEKCTTDIFKHSSRLLVENICPRKKCGR